MSSNSGPKRGGGDGGAGNGGGGGTPRGGGGRGRGRGGGRRSGRGGRGGRRSHDRNGNGAGGKVPPETSHSEDVNGENHFLPLPEMRDEVSRRSMLLSLEPIVLVGVSKQ